MNPSESKPKKLYCLSAIDVAFIVGELQKNKHTVHYVENVREALEAFNAPYWGNNDDAA